MSLSKEERSKINKNNAKKAWIKIQEKLKDPEYAKEWREKVSNKNQLTNKQREARRQNMVRLNKSKEQRKRSSETMKNTWATHEGMNEKSHKWQEDKEKLREVMKRSHEAIGRALKEEYIFVSKNEKAIREWLEELGFHLDSGRILIEEKSRFFDIRIGSLFIEIDGPWHFDEFFDRFPDHVRDPSSDNDKDEWILKNRYTLLRVSNWGDALEDQKAIISAYLDKDLKPGIFKEGLKYAS